MTTGLQHEERAATQIATVRVRLSAQDSSTAAWSAWLTARDSADATVAEGAIPLDATHREGVPQALSAVIVRFLGGAFLPHVDDLAWFGYEIDEHTVRVRRPIAR